MVKMHSELGRMEYSLMHIEQQSEERYMTHIKYSWRYVIWTSMHFWS